MPLILIGFALTLLALRLADRSSGVRPHAHRPPRRQRLPILRTGSPVARAAAVVRTIRRDVTGAPNELSEEAGTPRLLDTVKRSLRLWRPHLPLATAIAGMEAVSYGYLAGLAVAFSFIIDTVLPTHNLARLLMWVGGLGVGMILYVASAFGNEYFRARARAAILRDVRQDMFGHLQRLSSGFVTRGQAGNILARFSTDLADADMGLTNAPMDAMGALIGMTIAMVTAAFLDWRLPLLLLAVLGSNLIGIERLMARRAHQAVYRLKQSEGRLLAGLQENIRAQAVIRGFGMQQEMVSRFRLQLAALVPIHIRGIYWRRLTGELYTRMFDVASWLALVVGIGMAFNGVISVGALVGFYMIMAESFFFSQQAAKDTLPNWLAAGGALRRIDELMGETPRVLDRPGSRPLPRLRREIRLDAVSFAHEVSRPVLRNVSASIPARGLVAFVGSSGAGKSTLLNLLARFDDVSEGAITFDGMDVRDATQASLLEQLGLVFQETYLFNTTIRNNLRLGKFDATEDEIEAAARAAEIHDTIAALPNGYQTQVGEAGAFLSVGQRQRLALARALLRNPAVLLLDEITSALDPVTERALIATLERLAKDRLVVMVTHRLGSVVNADLVFVLEAGEIVETGRHADLLAMRGAYRRLWEGEGLNGTDVRSAVHETDGST